MLSVSARMSTKTGTPPRSTKAFAVDTNVNDGMITSSPGRMSARSAAISSAAVHECVSSALRQPDPPLEPGAAPLRERAVAGQVAQRVRLARCRELLARHVRLVERDCHGCTFAGSRLRATHSKYS